MESLTTFQIFAAKYLATSFFKHPARCDVASSGPIMERSSSSETAWRVSPLFQIFIAAKYLATSLLQASGEM
jgi:hypothetical protein